MVRKRPFFVRFFVFFGRKKISGKTDSCLKAFFFFFFLEKTNACIVSLSFLIGFYHSPFLSFIHSTLSRICVRQQKNIKKYLKNHSAFWQQAGGGTEKKSWKKSVSRIIARFFLFFFEKTLVWLGCHRRRCRRQRSMIPKSQFGSGDEEKKSKNRETGELWTNKINHCRRHGLGFFLERSFVSTGFFPLLYRLSLTN